MAIRYIPGTEFRSDGTFVVSDANDYCQEVQGQLIGVLWDGTLSGTRPGAYFRSTLFGLGGDASIVINGVGFFCDNGGVVPPGFNTFAFAGLNTAQTYINFAQAINSVPACGFRAVQAGIMSAVTTDGPAGTGAGDIRGVDIEAITTGAIFNGVALSPAANNAVMWFSYIGGIVQITDGGGYRLKSKLTSEYQRCRVLLYVSGTTAQVKITSGDESYTSAAFAPATTNGLIYRQISNPYQFYQFTPGATSSFLFGGTPAMPDFQKGLRITGCTNTAPVRVTTEAAHGLTTGENVFIADAEETVAVASATDAPLYASINLIRPYRIQIVTGGHEFTAGQVVNVSTVGGATGANGDWKIREVDASSFVLQDAHNDFAADPYTSGGVVRGPRNSTNGLWTVTVIDDQNFTLDTSDGLLAGSYVANTGICGKVDNDNRKLARCLFLTGTGTSPSFRTSMYHAQTAAIAVNASNYTGGDNIGSPRTVFPGFIGEPLLWSDDCAILCEPYITLGVNGLASQARIVGQPWDCALITQDYTDEATAVFDGHNWVKVTGTTSGSLQTGSLWFAISVVP
jgi:hypothetical protein